MDRRAISPLALLAAAVCVAALSIPDAALSAGAAGAAVRKPYYLPSGDAAKMVTVTESGSAVARITVLTEAVAVKETGPRQTVARFGEVYAFSPSFIAVRQNEPTMLTFWNLQPDDDHDLALMGPKDKVLMYVLLPPLTKTSFVFTFHKVGLFRFNCLRHPPEMSGQILVIGSHPPGARPRD
jgi:plastocyanin